MELPRKLYTSEVKQLVSHATNDHKIPRSFLFQM